MRTAEEEAKFNIALDDWKSAALAYHKAREDCRLDHATATAVAAAAGLKGGVAAIKADADKATTMKRTLRDAAEVQERVAFHSMIFLRGIHGEGSSV